MIFVHFWWWFQHLMGIDNLAGRPYGFWSGIGSDIGEASIIIGLLGAYHAHNCHEDKCWRIGKHRFDGTPYCTKHHPKLGEQNGITV